jgi:hypothetical protein
VYSDPGQHSFSSEKLRCVRLIAGQFDDQGAIIFDGVNFLSTDLRLIASAVCSSGLELPPSGLVSSVGDLGCWRRHIPNPFTDCEFSELAWPSAGEVREKP